MCIHSSRFPARTLALALFANCDSTTEMLHEQHNPILSYTPDNDSLHNHHSRIPPIILAVRFLLLFDRCVLLLLLPLWGFWPVAQLKSIAHRHPSQQHTWPAAAPLKILSTHQAATASSSQSTDAASANIHFGRAQPSHNRYTTIALSQYRSFPHSVYNPVPHTQVHIYQSVVESRQPSSIIPRDINRSDYTYNIVFCLATNTMSDGQDKTEELYPIAVLIDELKVSFACLYTAVVCTRD